MRKKRIGIIISIVVILALALLVLYLYSNSKPGVYTEETTFDYRLYFIVLDEKGDYSIHDLLGRHQNYYIAFGKYYLYKSKLVLVDNRGDIELVFAADGDNWVFQRDESSGLDILGMKHMDDQAIWTPWP